jgi:hypothetical protein
MDQQGNSIFNLKLIENGRRRKHPFIVCLIFAVNFFRREFSNELSDQNI